MKHHELPGEMVTRLMGAMGQTLDSVVLYGPAARGDDARAVRHLHLLVVLSDLDPDTLARLREPVWWWLRKRQPWPRLFTRELVFDALDIYPIELLDISRHHRVLYGSDFLRGVEVELDKLRLQCERELREKIMRLREGYVETGGNARALRRLLAESYASFDPIWRGCLHLLGSRVPTQDQEVIATLAERLDVPAAPLEAVAGLAAGATTHRPEVIFAEYYRALNAIVARIDRLVLNPTGESS